MDRLQAYLEIVPLPVLAVLALAGLVTAVSIPGRVRLFVALAIMPVWLSIGRLTDLGMIAAVCKATSILAYVFVAVAAFLDPNPKRRVPGIVWLYPLLAFMTIFFIATTTDRALAIVLRLQFVFLTLGAIGTVQTIIDEASLKRVLTALAVGSAGAIGVVFSYLLLHPGEIFSHGLGRLRPWGANQNQIGTIFLLGPPLLVYTALKSKNVLYQFTALGAGAVGILLAFMTASRSIVFPLALILGIIAWEFRKRPVMVAAGALGALVIVGYFGTLLTGVSVERLGNLETGRTTIWAHYFREIMHRPITGLFMTRGQTAELSEVIGAHAHNAFIQNFYWYGAALGLPFLALAIYSCFAATGLWKRRKQFADDAGLITVVWVFTGVVYLHGLTTVIIVYPTYAWAFFHVMMSVLVITLYKAKGHEFYSFAAWDDEMDDYSTDAYAGEYQDYDDYGDANDLDGAGAA